MAGDRPPLPHHHPPDITTITEHPDIAGKAARKRQIEGGDLPSTAHLFPATTSSGDTPKCSQSTPDIITSPLRPAPAFLVAGNAGSPSQVKPAVSGGFGLIPAISGGIGVAQVKSGKGSRPPTSEELKLLDTSDEPEEPAEDLEFDSSALPFASTDIDLGRRREKTPCTPAARTPLVCTLNRSANTIPSNRDFGVHYPSYCLDPGPSHEDVDVVRYHCDGRRYGEDSDLSDEDEDDLIWEEEQEDIKYKFEPKSKLGYYGNDLQPFQRDLEAARLSPARNYRKTRSRYRDYEERFLG
ncbi:unnamed protein product [Cuscuta campestris]|uniref:Uncharacterized protein n=1 Tax=Cuscuta campestris TaxID=132261 RepID=A0A484NLX0_9ASTE|nr:unnamed protein product [Cuscuta campestris]